MVSFSIGLSSESAVWKWPEAGWITREEMLRIPADEYSDPSLLCDGPSVSVLMMTRNHEKYLEEAVLSVLSQDLEEPYEILIGEDFSTDRTLDLAISLQKQHPTIIRVLHASENVGITSNFLRLVAHARGPFLALLEGDDYWTDSSKLTTQLQQLRNCPHAALAAAATINRTSCLPAKPFYTLSDLLRRYAVHTSTVIIRAEHLHSYPRYPDIVGWITMLMGYLASRGDCIYLNRYVSFYRRHEGGLWHGSDRLDRLRRSRQCIDALDAFFYHKFRHELVSRELWIHRMELALPQKQQFYYWCQSWSILLNQSPRLLRRAPLGFCLLVVRLLLQPFSHASMVLRRRLALGTRMRALVAGLTF